MEGNKVQNYKSCFDIIGPIMVGPSSSHTAGAIAIGALARQLFGGTPNRMCVATIMSLLLKLIRDMGRILRLLVES